MQINVKYLENLRLEALFDDFSLIADQPIRYKGDGSAPGPFDYFLASSAMCAAYFVKVYCNTRDIPTDEIIITQNNIIDPENRYKQSFHIEIQLPDDLSKKERKGIIASMERCSVKRVIQNSPEFIIEEKSNNVKNSLQYTVPDNKQETMITGKDCSLEETIRSMSKVIQDLGIKIEIASWRNQVPHVWSVHIRDADSPLCFTNGKGSTKDAALCSALGEYIERISCNYFYNDYYLGEDMANSDFVHYPSERWFKVNKDQSVPDGLMDDYLLEVYNKDQELRANHLIDTNSGNKERGICAVPYVRQSDNTEVFIPVALVGNLFVSNGMSAGNSKFEARVQCLSEIFERAIKNKIILEEISLPTVPADVLSKYPQILAGIEKLEEAGFPVIVKDASLGGEYPVACVTLLNPKNGGVFASFGAHPNFEVALERSLTELLQGRSFEGMKDILKPSFNEQSIQEHNNIIDHFIDSTGIISWNFFNEQNDYAFSEWNFSGSTEQENEYLMSILKKMNKEVYIADFEELGSYACRILVPDYSEIYPLEDLIWDNNNISLDFREDILNLHRLDKEKLTALINRLVESGLDDYMPISELIGVAFDENSVWGQLNIGELKCLSYLSIGELEDAKELVEMFIAFNDNSSERKKYYELVNILLDIELTTSHKIEYFQPTLVKMYGQELVSIAQKTLETKIKFYGLVETDLKLTGIDKHLRMLDSYQKLQNKRSQFFNKN